MKLITAFSGQSSTDLPCVDCMSSSVDGARQGRGPRWGGCEKGLTEEFLSGLDKEELAESKTMSSGQFKLVFMLL